MRIHTEIRFEWRDGRYEKTYDSFYEYEGPLEQACGATGQQKQIAQSQQNFMTQAQTQAGSVFGASNTVFQSLLKTFSPTIAAGPNQEGFSPALLSALKSQIITGAGTAYKNAKAAVGNAQSAYGGGNVVLPSGAQVETDLGLAENAANLTAEQLNQLTQENYAIGRENYNKAVTGLEQAPGVFGAATSATNAATGAGEAAANTANQVAQADQSWVSAVTGALGTIAGSTLGPLTGNLMKGSTPSIKSGAGSLTSSSQGDTG